MNFQNWRTRWRPDADSPVPGRLPDHGCAAASSAAAKASTHPAPDGSPRGALRFVVLCASVVMLAFLGTNQAWSVFVAPLRDAFAFSDSQLQFVFTTGTLTFCSVIILGGRLHDRFGVRPLALASAALMGIGWWLASAGGSRYFCLWLGIGVLVSSGSAMGYVCPLATAIKWFPHRAGLVAGLSAAGFGSGPILLSNVVEVLLRNGWPALRIFGLVGGVWAPVILATGLLLVSPQGRNPALRASTFNRRDLWVDIRFWTLFAGMLFGTLPYLVVMGSVKPLGTAFGIGTAAAAATISVVAGGNTLGRIAWGMLVDRLGPRRAMLAAQCGMLVSVLCLILTGRAHAVAFLVAAFGVGFCYGSNFSIYPATVSRLYGAHVIGSVYPFVMAAQGISSFGPTLNGMLFDYTGSYLPGLSLAAVLAAAGIFLTLRLSRTMATT